MVRKYTSSLRAEARCAALQTVKLSSSRCAPYFPTAEESIVEHLDLTPAQQAMMKTLAEHGKAELIDLDLDAAIPGGQ